MENERSPSKGVTEARTPTKCVKEPRSPTKGVTEPRTPIKGVTEPRSPTKAVTEPRTPTKGATEDRTPTLAVTEPRTPTKGVAEATPGVETRSSPLHGASDEGIIPGIGVFGTGPITAIVVPHLRSAGFRIEAVWGKTQEEADGCASRLDIPFATNKIDDVLLCKNVDLILVLSPPSLHSQITVKALGKLHKKQK